MSEYKVSPKSRQNIREITRDIRKKSGYEYKLYFPIVEFLELSILKTFPDFELEIKSAKEMNDICGNTDPSNHKIILNEKIYQKAINGDGFARMTIAHEIGHLYMHDSKSISICKLKPGEKVRPFEDPEWQADVFGGEFLASYYLINNLTINEISEKCGVTKRAAKVQISKL